MKPTTKPNKGIILLTFFAGLILGAALLWLLEGRCCKSVCLIPEKSNTGGGLSRPIFTDTTGVDTISAHTANSYFKNYYAHPDTVIGIKGFSITAKQFVAMKKIADADTSVHGFRIYFGKDAAMNPVRIVVGTGSPDKADEAYVTDAQDCGPCPNICDDSSPIIKE